MLVKELFYALQGANALQFDEVTRARLCLGSKTYSRQEFFHQFRDKAIWNMKIQTVRTDVKPHLFQYITVLTITL